MESLFRFVAPPSACGYLPDQTWQLEYEIVGRLGRAEYMRRMAGGWRRFGFALFHPQCPRCRACRSLRVVVDDFRPDRSQRRARQANADVSVVVGEPSVSRAKLDLYDRYHAFQADEKGWPRHEPKNAGDYIQSFVDNPFPTQEWCYYAGDRLIGVGYVDHLPEGLSAIYFFYDPDERKRSLGTFNVLSIIDRAAAEGLPHVYLGYFVDGCPSLAYKARFVPNQAIDPRTGEWMNFRG